ncbi:MAX dimerization protein MGA a isoform X2 [Nerophis ophidion]|uniref:MAX dimerization protein MGA a isoform X2 n=1 Tax=Nerophis ophidion TaxID=159077 RepID=UPI002ADF5F81|nr:MAX dimerization protein MGA a isoform X2 [Nerophis ophidion]
MASRTQNNVMVFDGGVVTSPAAALAADHLPNHFGQASQGKHGSHGRHKETGIMVQADIQPKASSWTPSGSSTMNVLKCDLLAPDSTCHGIRVTLDNNNMWNEFFRCKTEMIVTKQGSRMFPYCRFRISGLQPSKKYVLMMDVQPLDRSHYTWTGTSWQVAGKAENHVTSLPFSHPESPSMGQQWMQNPVSFYKLKLTSNTADKDGNAIIYPMHRYIPRLHVVQTEKAAKDIKLNTSNVATFTFQQTEFMAVTAYQNSQFVQLKVDYNPFAKGLKDDPVGSWGLKLKSHQDGVAKNSEHQPLKKNLKSLLANHKNRSCLEPKHSEVTLVQKTSSGSGPKGVKGMSCDPQPAQKLIADLIRDVHVPLKSCTVDLSGASQTFEQTKTGTTQGKGCSKDLPKADRKTIQSLEDISPQAKSDTCSDKIRTEVVSEGHKCPSQVGLNQSVKRPAPLTLPALALFLKQHSTKTKKVKSRLDSSPSQALTEVITGTDTASANPPSIASKPKPNRQDLTTSDGDQITGSVPGKVIESFQQPCSPSLTFQDTVVSPGAKESRYVDGVLESCAPEPSVLEEKEVLANVEQPLSKNVVFSCSSLTTSSSMVSPLFDTSVAHVPQALSLEPRSIGLLPDSPCSPFGFEPLSPASSPETLPPLPDTFTLDLDSVPSESPERLPAREHSCPSVFKWHTVLPPSEPYVNSPFTEFRPTSPTVSLEASLLPSETPTNISSQPPSNPQAPTTPTDLQSQPSVDSQPLTHSDSPTVHTLSFQENEQPLPFPGELSPLVLPLALSPTFSSLDGEGLSPTPSIADLVHFFSTNDHLGMGMDFPSTDSLTLPCPPDASGEANSRQPHHSPKELKCKKRSRQQKLAKSDLDQKIDDLAYTTMQPNLEEVEEQLFISFTSKEALQLHLADCVDKDTSSCPVASPQVQPSQRTEERLDGKLLEPLDLEETIAAFEDVLIRDMKLMKHQQIIHPVLQEVGLKMNLLDPTLAIDLQYLGVRLPLPPPGASQEPPSQDLPPLQNQSPSGRVQNGASTSFVSRTGKTTDLTQIKGWREKFSSPETSTAPPASNGEGPAVCVGPEQTKKNLSAFCSDMLDQYLESEAKLIQQSTSSFSVELPPVYQLPAAGSSSNYNLSAVVKKPTSDLISGFIPPSKRSRVQGREPKATKKGERKQKSSKMEADHQATPSQPLTETSDPVPATSQPSVFRRKRLQSKTSSQAGMADMPPLESDSEADAAATPRLSVTQGLLRQKDLEDSAQWAGRPRTFITEERAAIALTSLFTLMGFVSDNPTAPIRLPPRPTTPCFNDFCRLGCVCSSLAYTSRISHCGRPQCMLGCSCLKQKVVLLKNLDGSDSSPSQHGTGKRRKRKRMKMAYILKEADSVSQPAERVRTLWKRDSRAFDPEPNHIPEAANSSCTGMSSKATKPAGSCARVRRFLGKKLQQEPPPKTDRRTLQGRKSKVAAAEPAATPSKPSRRLTILTECGWKLDADRDYVLKKLCEAMARHSLDKPFWARKYHISPISQTVEGSGAGRCIHYKVLISRSSQAPQEDNCTLVVEEVKAGQEPVEDWQRALVEEDLVEDLQREVNESDLEEKEVQVLEKRKSSICMALPFLTTASAAGFLSASKKKPGQNNCVQVNGKLYPLAKIQLGEMGALHPANRLAAYVTGRMLGKKKQEADPSQSKPCAPAQPPPTVAPTMTIMTTAVNPPMGSIQVRPLSAGSSAPPTGLAPPTSPQVVMLTYPPFTLPVLPPPKNLPSPSVRVVLRPVQSTTGEQYYRRADGKLVQLIPVSQLRPPTGLGLGSSPILMDSSPLPMASSNAGALAPPSSASSQNGTCAMKILPVTSTRDPVPSAKPPLPRTKIGTVPEDCKDETTPLRSKAIPSAPPIRTATEPARGPVDLDVICVDDDMEADLGAKREIPEINLIDSSSGETDHSSDVTEDSSDADEKNLLVQERRRRHRMSPFDLNMGALRQEVQVDANTPTSSTLKKALHVIQQLRTSETRLKREKRVLARKREHLLNVIPPPAGHSCHDSSPGTSSCGPESDSPILVAPDVTVKNEYVLRNAVASKSGGVVRKAPDQCGLGQLHTADLDSKARTAGVCEDLQPGDHQSGPNEGKSASHTLHHEQAPSTTCRRASSPKHHVPAASNQEVVVRNQPNILCRRKSLPSPSDAAARKASPPNNPLFVGATMLPGKPVLTQLAGHMVSSPAADNSNSLAYLAPPTNKLQPHTEEAPPPVSMVLSLSSAGSHPTSDSRQEVAYQEDGGASVNEMGLLESTAATDQTSMVAYGEVGLNGHMATDESLKGAVLTPPPLLHMKVGGAKMEAHPNTVMSSGPGTEPRGDGVSWRPMPRLVPLGLKGAPPT